MIDSPHDASIHAFNCITLHPDLAHLVEILIIADGMSWILRRRSWRRKREEVRLHKSKTSGWIYMLVIAS